jgi:hypothetical protein
MKPDSIGNDVSEISALLESQTLERCDTLKRLLIYLWRHRGEEFNEYSIATEALGRRAEFDPRIDATVRVQIARLRQKFQEFYNREGLNFPLLLTIPSGSHSLEVEWRTDTVPEPEEAEAAPAVSWRSIAFALVIVCSLLAATCAGLLWKGRGAASSLIAHDSEVMHFWRDFLGDAEGTLIVLPTPTFMTFRGKYQMHVRDVNVNEFSAWQSSPELLNLSKRYGVPHLDDSYTSSADTFAAINLARFLDTAGMGKGVTFVDSTGAPMDALDRNNEIVFGTHFTLHPFQTALGSMTFYMAPNEDYVQNLRPAPGEPAKFVRLVENGGRGIEPSVFAVLPGRNVRTRLLILQAPHTSALIRFLTSSAGIASLYKMWKEHGSPRYYEAVVSVEMAGASPLSSKLVALHEYQNRAEQPRNTR